MLTHIFIGVVVTGTRRRSVCFENAAGFVVIRPGTWPGW